ncbi:hypothetical protein M758_4G045300 [Ceratodon purpureus]|uniref:Uncharacterized protein n=1 Tax=Ceratodon purpureus TaxID=3225 RepID=A0A8T0I6T2_CERPU|nr:hypothetical protein KC19_4G048300 [Ceratodon purpureus]KAG0618193.1 hypothetical protein M758_4G045300 [Ceratodon purpureus]
MSQGFLTWPDVHPILVGAGCLALGYVYGRHCRASGEIPADEPAASEEACCAQSQSNTYFEDLERCKCCMSAPAELDTTAVGKEKGSRFSTRSPYMIQDAAEGFEQAERSAKRDLEHRNSMDRYGHHMKERDCTNGEGHGMHQHSSSTYFEKSYQILEEERVLRAKTPHKKQKGTPVVKELFCSKGKAELSRVGDEDDAAASVPWSQEVLNKRIDYFNNVISASGTTDSERSDESRKLRHFRKKFLKVSACSKGEPTYNSISTSSQKSISNSGGLERPTCGLVPLATPDRDGCSHDNSPNSPHRIFGGGCNAATAGDTSVVPKAVQNFIPEGSKVPETLSIVGRLHTRNDPEGNSKDADRDADSVTQPACEPNKEMLGNELESTTAAPSSMQAELLQTPSETQAPKHDVPDRCSERMELKKEVLVDKVLKAEIYGLLNEADSSKVSFQGIVSLLGMLQHMPASESASAFWIEQSHLFPCKT